MSGAGNGCLSTSVIDVFLNGGRLHKERAVERPKTPDPIMRIEDGILSAPTPDEDMMELNTGIARWT
jgi:hypothetical protein